MGLLSAVKKVGSSLKKTFMPSQAEAAARRQKVFGSTSKLKAGGVIVGTAAAAIAAPILGKKIAAKLSSKAAPKGGSIAKSVVSKVTEKVKPAIGAKVKAIATQTQMADTSTAPIGKTNIMSSLTKIKTTRARGMVKTRRKSLAWYKRQTALLKAKREYAKARGY